MRLGVVVYSTGNLGWTTMAVEHLRRTVNPELTEIVVIDNGSREPFPALGDRNYRYAENVGGNAVFHRWYEDAWWEPDTEPDYLAFFHCDLMVHEPGWDQRVVDAFDADPLLGLIGFVGSWEIDELGGRGGGTMLNYAGSEFPGYGRGSSAEDHGERVRNLRPAAVLDHCSMIFRRPLLLRLPPQEGNYAPEHFYDRILSCATLELGYRVAVLGISVDHFSGGIGPGAPEAEALRKRWLEQEGLTFDLLTNPADLYVESERRFKRDYVETKFVPLKVNGNWEITR